MSSIQLDTSPGRTTLSEAALPWVAVVVVLLLALGIYVPFPVNHDAAWIVMGAERMLDGGVFGHNVVDVNPPLAWWLSMPAAVIARFTGFTLALAFQLYVLAVGLGCLMLSARLLRLQGVTAGGMALAAIATVFWLFPAYDFGQREHFMLMLACPYVLICALRSTGHKADAPTAVVAGILGGLAFCLKPYFLVIPAGLAAISVLHARQIRIVFTVEAIALAAVGAAYIAAIYRFAPDYLAVIVPDALIGYGAYSNPLLPVARTYLTLLLPSVLAVILLSNRFSGQALPAASRYLLAAGALAAIAAIVQQKGWSYHIMPAIGFVIIAAAIALGRWAANCGWRLKPAVVVAAVLIALALVRPVQAHLRDLASSIGNHAVTLALAERLDKSNASASVFAFITSPRNVHPAVLRTGAKWAAPACCTYLLPAHVRDGAGDAGGQAADARRAVAERQLAQIGALLAAAPPDFIMVDDRPHKLGFAGMQFDYLEWLENKPGFASLWARYREDNPAGHFRIFVRKGRWY